MFPPLTADGQPGSSSTLNQTVNTITAFIDNLTSGSATQASVLYAGLAPGYAGLYQLNLTVPSGLTAGDNYLEIDVLNSAGNPTSVSEEAIIPIGSGGSSVPVIRPEIENGQTYQSTKHRAPEQLKRHITLKPVQP